MSLMRRGPYQSAIRIKLNLPWAFHLVAVTQETVRDAIDNKIFKEPADGPPAQIALETASDHFLTEAFPGDDANTP